MAGVYSRVTVVGVKRRIDVVLPADEAVGAMTGDLIRMLDEPSSSPPLHRYLVSPAGDVLGGDATLAAAKIEDGAVLRLVGEEGLPPAPVVYDVAEETASDRDARRWAFTTTHRQVIGGAAFAAMVLAMSMLVQAADVWPNAPAVLAGVLVIAAVVLGRVGRPALSSGVLVAGVLVGLHFLVTADATASWEPWRRWAAVVVALLVTPLLFALAGRPPRGAVMGSAVGAVLLGLWVGGVLLGFPTDQIASVLAVVSVAVLGFLPRAALMVSGIASLDDRRAGGREVARRDVEGALSAAHEGLVLASFAAAASAATAGVLLSAELTRWTIPIGCLLAFLFLSRSRVFPLVPEVVGLVATGLVVAVAFVRSWSADSGLVAGPLGVLAGLAALALLAVAVSLTEHAEARLRIVLDRIEMLAVVAMIPLVVGVFGTYSRLLAMF